MAEIYAYSYLDASGLVKTGPGVLHSVTVSAAAATVTATVYDEVAGAGDVIAVITTIVNDSKCAIFDVAFGVGCYVTLAGAGGKATVSFA